MANVIIYRTDNNKVGVCYPNLSFMEETGVTIQELAKKDIPFGSPYFIVDETVVPDDLAFSDAWEVDFTNPDGTGLDYGTGSSNEVIGWANGLPIIGE